MKRVNNTYFSVSHSSFLSFFPFHALCVCVKKDGIHEASTGVEIRVKDVQNRPPVFQGSLAAVINEDSPIGTLVARFQAKDGDHGQPRRVVYDLLSSKQPIDYNKLAIAKATTITTASNEINFVIRLFCLFYIFRSNGLFFIGCKNW